MLTLQQTLNAVTDTCAWLAARSSDSDLPKDYTNVHAGLGFGWRLCEQGQSDHFLADSMYYSFSGADDALASGVAPVAIMLFDQAMKELLQCLQIFDIVGLVRLLDATWMLGKKYDFALKGSVGSIVRHIDVHLGQSNPLAKLLRLVIEHGHGHTTERLIVWEALINNLQAHQKGNSSNQMDSVVSVARYYHAKTLLRTQNYSAAIEEFETISKEQPAHT